MKQVDCPTEGCPGQISFYIMETQPYEMRATCHECNREFSATATTGEMEAHIQSLRASQDETRPIAPRSFSCLMTECEGLMVYDGPKLMYEQRYGEYDTEFFEYTCNSCGLTTLLEDFNSKMEDL